MARGQAIEAGIAAMAPEQILYGDLGPRGSLLDSGSPGLVTASAKEVLARMKKLEARSLKSTADGVHLLVELFGLAADLEEHPRAELLKDGLLEIRLQPRAAEATAERIFTDFRPRRLTPEAAVATKIIASVEEMAATCRRMSATATADLVRRLTASVLRSMAAAGSSRCAGR